MPLATRLNATWGREWPTLRSLSHDLPPSRPDRAKRQVLYLEEILRYDGEALRVVGNALEVGVLVQNIVINVQEELEGVLVQEVDLEGEVMAIRRERVARGVLSHGGRPPWSPVSGTPW